MELSFSSIAAGIIFGSFGLYAIKLGKKKSNVIQIIIGITLLTYSYFIPNLWINWGIGSVLLILLFKKT